MRYSLFSVAVATLALSACANQSGAQMGLFTTKTPVVAIVAGDLYTGHSVCYLDGTGDHHPALVGQAGPAMQRRLPL